MKSTWLCLFVGLCSISHALVRFKQQVHTCSFPPMPIETFLSNICQKTCEIKKTMGHRGVKIRIRKKKFGLKSRFPKGYGAIRVEIKHQPRGWQQFRHYSGDILINQDILKKICHHYSLFIIYSLISIFIYCYLICFNCYQSPSYNTALLCHFENKQFQIKRRLILLILWIK